MADQSLNMPATGPTHPMPARNQFYCYDAQWRLTSLRTADGCAGTALNTLTYDVQGNVASKDGTTYDFDFGNRLRSVSSGGTTQESYRYDAYGRRALSIGTNGNLLSFYDHAGQLMYQRDLRQGKLLNYIYLGGSLVAIADQGLWGGAVTAKRYQHTDALGTPVAVTDENRNVIERSEYEPYGLLLNRAQHDGPGFTGHVQDALTGLTYMQQRYYDPMIGRFLSVDPVTATSVGGNFNRYWYANDNPYRFTDPDGRQACGHDWDCRMSAQRGGPAIRSALIRTIQKNPQGYLDRINSGASKHSYQTERGAARYAANLLIPLSVATGNEGGAFVANTGGDKPFTTSGYKLGDATSVGKPAAYSGPGIATAWVHTHLNNTAVSGWGGIYSSNPSYGYQGFRTPDKRYGDTWVGIKSGLTIYAAGVNGAMSRFDSGGFNEAIRNGAYTVKAEDYMQESP